MLEKVKNSAESDLDALEQQVPRLASEATHSAYQRALTLSPQGVLRIDNGDLVREAPDGMKTVICKAKPRRRVNVGEVVIVRKINEKSADDGA
ncbi:hypothetical protein AB7M33_005422 [Pseudomonas sp. Y3 TE3536]